MTWLCGRFEVFGDLQYMSLLSSQSDYASLSILLSVAFPRACFKKNPSLHILAETFLNDLFRILPEIFSILPDDLYFSHRRFLRYQPLHFMQISPISYCLNTLYPLIPLIYISTPTY